MHKSKLPKPWFYTVVKVVFAIKKRTDGFKSRRPHHQQSLAITTIAGFFIFQSTHKSTRLVMKTLKNRPFRSG
jgi:hypothetical protein